jgi:hypothetical protein
MYGLKMLHLFRHLAFEEIKKEFKLTKNRGLNPPPFRWIVVRVGFKSPS